jgi:hypothetical protein
MKNKDNPSIYTNRRDENSYRIGKIMVTSFVVLEFVFNHVMTIIAGHRISIFNLLFSFIFPVGYYYGRKWARIWFCIKYTFGIVFDAVCLIELTQDITLIKVPLEACVLGILFTVLRSIMLLCRKNVLVFLNEQRKKDFLD